jgi:hypothetical protein
MNYMTIQMVGYIHIYEYACTNFCFLPFSFLLNLNRSHHQHFFSRSPVFFTRCKDGKDGRVCRWTTLVTSKWAGLSKLEL